MNRLNCPLKAWISLILPCMLVGHVLGNIASDYQFKHLTVDDGLSQTSIEAICQDFQGFMWFGTQNGLNRFDGYQFKQYYNEPDNDFSLNSNSIKVVFEDSKKRLWVGTSLGVNQYDWNKDHFIPTKITNKTQVLDNGISTIIEDKNGVIWASSHYLVYQYNEELNEFFSVPPPSDIYGINTICYDSTLNLLIGADSGLYIDNQLIDISTTGFVKSVLRTQDGMIWFNAAGLIYEYDPLTESANEYDIQDAFPDIPNIVIREMKHIYENEIWVTTYYGIAIFDLNKRVFTKTIVHDPDKPQSLSDNSQTSICKDQHGSIWIGTYSGGLNYLENEYRSFEHFHQIPYSNTSINSNIISAITESPEGHLLVGTGRGGLNVLNQDKDVEAIYFEDLNIRELEYAQDGSLYIGTYMNGLLQVDENFKITNHYTVSTKPGQLDNNFIFSVVEDIKERLWVSTWSGVSMKEKSGDTFKRYRLDPDFEGNLLIYDIIETSDHSIILSSELGVHQYNEEDDSFKYLIKNDPNEPNKLPDSIIFSLYEDDDSLIWIGTKKGLAKYNRKTGKSFVFNNVEGVKTHTVYAITSDDDGHIWISTNHGITKIDPVNLTAKNFDVSDGLQGNEFRKNAYQKCSDGSIAFGGGNGFNLFNPNKINSNPTKPRLVFTDLLIKNEVIGPNDPNSPLTSEIVVADKIVLAPTQNIFTIKYAALNFKSSHKNQYAYFLEGFEADWNYVGTERSAKYTNLKPGDYIFHAKASNNDGVWNETGSVLAITVLPFYWQTMQFKILLVLAILGLVLLFVRWKLKATIKQKVMLEQSVINRTSDLQSSREQVLEQNNLIHKQLNELESHRNNLEELVIQRTSQLEEEKTKAERADALKTSFLANMSHEIRTPLNAILGFSEIICEESYDQSEKDDLINIIKSNSNSLLKLIDDILDLSRIESNQIELESETVDLEELTSDLENIFNWEISQGQHLIDPPKLVRKGEPIRVKTDEIRLRQVLTNLISNALKFTEKGSVSFEYKRDGENILFSVSDTGIGIPADKLGTVFGRFQKVETTDKLYRGTGLGLAISHRLVSLLGGTIWVESTFGKGSTFFFTLPYKPTETRPTKTQHKSTDDCPDLNHRKILIAEDDDNNFQFINHLVKKTGASTVRAKDGIEAVEWFQNSNDFDLILMDLKMPRMDGFEAFRAITNLSGGNIPVIAQTAHALGIEEQKAKEAGFHSYITKPINKALLYQAISNCLSE